LPSSYTDPFDSLIEKYTHYTPVRDSFLVESYMTGYQVTLDGYVYKGAVHFLGIVDSIMFDGTICFKSFKYPTRLSRLVQQRIWDISRRYVEGIGLDNTMFNIEFIYNAQENTIKIIEINPRVSSQFADLYEKIDGVNTYSLAVSLALGQKPTYTKKIGKHRVAASFVLRTFKDYMVKKVPSIDDIKRARACFPDIRLELFAIQGKRLSYYEQDGKSFRYGLVHLGGKSKQDLQYNFERCQQILRFEFE